MFLPPGGTTLALTLCAGDMSKLSDGLEDIPQMERILAHRFGSAGEADPGQMHNAGDRVSFLELENGCQVSHVHLFGKDPLADLIPDEGGLANCAALGREDAGSP